MKSNLRKRRIAVIGAGITGCSVAAALSERSYDVTIFECEPQVMSAASRYNEGKIHLGYTFAMDKTLETARLMAHSALQFEPLLARWFGSTIRNVPYTPTFHYAVHKDSLVSPDEYEMFAQAVSSIVHKEITKDSSYFGSDMHQRPSRLTQDELTQHYNPLFVSGVFRTNELSIDPEAIADIIHDCLPSLPGITVRCNCEILSIAQDQSEYVLTIKIGDDTLSESFDCVINTSWRDRLRLDEYIGIKPPTSPLFRFKYYVRTHSKGMNVPSTTIVLGAFGDALNFKDATFLSWYPVGRTEWHEGITPKKIGAILSDTAKAEYIKEEILAGLTDILPALQSFPDVSYDIKGNWIYATGKTDVNTKNTQLHQRSDVGIERKGSYFSINPGKYTSAPHFAHTFAEMFDNEK